MMTGKHVNVSSGSHNKLYTKWRVGLGTTGSEIIFQRSYRVCVMRRVWGFVMAKFVRFSPTFKINGWGAQHVKGGATLTIVF